jgi:hypothetical protein
MNRVRKRGTLGYEDLMRELEEIEKNLLAQDQNDLAMSLMVLETKFRDRFQFLESRIQDQWAGLLDEKFLNSDDLSADEIQDLIPKDIVPFPLSPQEMAMVPAKQKKWETMGTAAALAAMTGLGVLGLASFIQIVMAWLG